jgi:hypothetical protein
MLNKQAIVKEGESAIFNTVKTGIIHPYIMNNDTAKTTIVKNARKDPVDIFNVTKSTTKIHLSSGAYKEIIFPLLDHWTQVLQDGLQHRLVSTPEHNVTLVSVRSDTDESSNTIDALAHFKFDSENIQVHMYHTNQSMMIQGPSHVSFGSNFLLPVLKDMVSQATEEIKEFNCHIIRTLRQGQDDTVWRSATPDRFNTLKLVRHPTALCKVCHTDCTTKTQLKNHMDTSHGTSLDLQAKPMPEILSTLAILHPMAPVPTQGQVQRQIILAEGESLLEGDFTEDAVTLEEVPLEPPPSTHSSTPAPAVRRRSEALNRSTSKLLQSSQAAEASLSEVSISVPTPDVPILLSTSTKTVSTLMVPSSVTTSVVPATVQFPCRQCSYTGRSHQDLRGHTYTIHRGTGEVTGFTLTQNIVLTKSQIIPDEAFSEELNAIDISDEKDDTTDSADIIEIEAEELPYQCAVCSKTFKDLNNVNEHFETHGRSETAISILQKICSLETMWKRKFDEQTLQVASLQHRVYFLQSRLRTPEGDKDQPLCLEAPVLPPKAVPQPPNCPQTPPLPAKKQQQIFKCKDCSYQSQVRNSLNDHIAFKHTFSCGQCRYMCSNSDKLDQHIALQHNKPNTDVVVNTLMVGDSHIKTVKPRVVEKAVGGRLFVPGYSRPRGQGRAYCSSRDWPNARFPDNSLEYKVPELLSERDYKNLIIQAPCNDITNLKVFKNEAYQYSLAEQSSYNTLAVAENALREFTSLEKVIILERLPRADNDRLSELSLHSNNVLHQAAESSEFRDRISVRRHTSFRFDTEEKIVDIFGHYSSPRYDGIHLVGKLGRQLYTDSVLTAVRTAGISDWTTQGIRCSARVQSNIDTYNVVTNNKYGMLNC